MNFSKLTKQQEKEKLHDLRNLKKKKAELQGEGGRGKGR